MSSVRLKRGEVSLGFVPFTPAYFQGTPPVSPAATTNTTFPGVMMGVPGTIVPSYSGRIFMAISGTMLNNAINCGGQVVCRFGTGIKPSNGASVAGTTVGGIQSYLGGYPVQTLKTAPANPTGTTNTTGLMAGLGGVLVPRGTGSVFVTAVGSIANNTLNDGAVVELRYGTGAVPSNGDAPSGFVRADWVYRTGPWGAGTITPFSISGIIDGLTIGTQIWIDLVQAAVTAGTVTLTGAYITAFELPSVTSVNMEFPLSLSAVITGLGVGITYWLDVSANAVGGGAFSLQNVAICAHEF